MVILTDLALDGIIITYILYCNHKVQQSHEKVNQESFLIASVESAKRAAVNLQLGNEGYRNTLSDAEEVTRLKRAHITKTTNLDPEHCMLISSIEPQQPQMLQQSEEKRASL